MSDEFKTAEGIVNWRTFPNIGYIYTKLPEDVLKSLREEVEDIRNNFVEASKFNMNLVGHIKKEFALVNTKDMIDAIACSMAEQYFHYFPQVKSSTVRLSPECEYDIAVSQPWVNFQEKHEYNPIHKHNGVLSFVIWLDIPFSIEEERKLFPDLIEGNNTTASFAFHYLDTIGNIATYNIPVDKSFNGTMAMFPAALNHSVNPFYTSDEYRVTIAGNVHYK